MQTSVLSKGQLVVSCKPLYWRHCRTITDIQWHKDGDETHLHVMDGRNTRYKFDIKLQKLEKQKLAAERRRSSPKQMTKPGDLKQIELPNYIERGPSDILRAIAGTLKRDFTAPNYVFHDDPFLIPYTTYAKRDYMLAKNNGKRAARFILNEHPELFEKNLIDMVPKIKAFMPKARVTEKSSNPGLFKVLIESSNVGDAKKCYTFLTKSQKAKIDGALKQQFLELLCFHNSGDEELPEDYHEIAGVMSVETKRWEAGGLADHVANEIISAEGIKSESAQKARMALMLGKAKFNDPEGVLMIQEEMTTNGFKLDIDCYNAVIKARGLTQSSQWIDIENVLKEMDAEGIAPNRETLLRIVQALNHMRTPDVAFSKVLSTFAEFKSLRILPSLGTYAEFIDIFRQTPNKFVVKDILTELSKIQKEKGTLVHEMISDECFGFCRAAITLAKAACNTQTAYQIDDLVMADPYSDVLRGGQCFTDDYFYQFFYALIQHDNIDSVFALYELYQPNLATPAREFYIILLKEIKKHHKEHMLPKIWTDLLANEFTRSPFEKRFALMNTFGEVALSFGLSVDENLQKTFACIGRDMFSILSKNHGEKRRNIISTPNDGKILNTSLKLCLEYGDYETAKEIVDFGRQMFTRFDDNLGEKVLTKFVDVMISQKEVTQAYTGIVFMHELRFSKGAETLAIKLGEEAKSALQKTQKETLNNLFSHGQKWVML